ncbi:O-succinylbenzoate synthase [Kineococcus radiotolerans]|uniref:o-succinylbenzoate synthase n=1 Tax=Kineococcus radiotolerans TaxID=131568 RepID=A0A7W4TLA1_KINRA|nr:o-succinylbenzoate synthase [Kineococcus radiotolerans]MBB2900703.1 O-succinylbenzoate synthase [Kineococcus radiotolerans]
MPPLPPLTDLLDAAHVVTLPLRRRFRGITEREALLLRGPAGWGEFAPFLEYGPVESARWLDAGIEAAWRGFPPPRRERVEVNATVPAVDAADVPAVLARFPGCRTAKVKVAEAGAGFAVRLAQDVARVAAVREALGPRGAVRVDANAGWSVEQAFEALTVLGAFGLEYAEQPCATLEEMALLRRRLAAAGTPVPLAADESVRKAEDPLRVAGLEAADVVVVKVAPLSGVARALEVARSCGLPVVVSSALDTSVGLAAGTALAAALPDLPHACGLGTAALLAADVSAEPLLPVGGSLPVGPARADPELLERHRAPADRERWWRERLAAAHAVLARDAAAAGPLAGPPFKDGRRTADS